MKFAIDIREKNGLRTLHFGSDWVQGAMRVAHSWDLELDYTREMMVSLLLRDQSSFPRNILLIGLGAASLTKFLYRHCPLAQLTVAEIDARVVAAARQHFELPDDPARLSIVIGDGAEYVMSTGKSYDLILVDGFNEHAHPGDLNTLPFYRSCRARLNDQGLLAVNLIGLCHGVKGGFAHIESAFEGRSLMLPVCKSGNTIAFAATGEAVCISLDELVDKSLEFAARTGLVLLPTLQKLDHAQTCRDGVLSI